MNQSADLIARENVAVPSIQNDKQERETPTDQI